MPIAGRGPPPKDCPICREKIWSREDVKSVYGAWQRYNVHVHANHSEYERWNIRISRSFFIALLSVFLAFSVAATQVASTNVARFLVAIPLTLAIPIFAVLFVTRRRGTRRFRDSWNEEHGAPGNPI